jgi:hypothetical protein
MSEPCQCPLLQGQIKVGKQANAQTISLPREVSDPEKGEVADWLSLEAFQFYSVVAKIHLAAQELEANSNPSDDGTLQVQCAPSRVLCDF